MKFQQHCILFILSSVLFSTALLAQDRLKPSKTETLATFTFLNPNNQPFANSEVLFKGNKGSKVVAKTDASGVVKTLLPNNEDFTTLSGEYENHQLLKTGNRAYSAIGGKRYTHRFIEYSFYYKNYDGEGVKDELVTVVSNSGKNYTQTTDAKGLALFYLPIEEKYTVHLTHYPNAKTIDIPDAGHSYVQLSHPFQWMSSAEKEQADIRQAETAQQIAQAEVAQKAAKEKAAAKATKEAAQKAQIENSIPPDEATVIVFFASEPEHKGVGTITVYDGGKDGPVIGTVRSVWNCTRGPVKEAQIEAKTIKRKGTYTYYAKSTQGMEWEGTYEVSTARQKNIPLRIKHK